MVLTGVQCGNVEQKQDGASGESTVSTPRSEANEGDAKRKRRLRNKETSRAPFDQESGEQWLGSQRQKAERDNDLKAQQGTREVDRPLDGSVKLAPARKVWSVPRRKRRVCGKIGHTPFCGVGGQGEIEVLLQEPHDTPQGPPPWW